MIRLEKRVYSREEIATIVGITDLKDSHFAEKVRRYLDNRLYDYDYSRRGVKITRCPETAEERLTSLVRGELGLDCQINAIHFSYFIAAFSLIESFASMPWASREAFYNLYFKPEDQVPGITLKRWMSVLVETGNATRFKKGTLWKTIKDEDGDKIQVRVDPESEEYQEYCGKRSALLEGFEKADKEARKQIWSNMVHTLLPDYGVYYYCPEFTLNALGEHAEEISQLVAAVMAERREEEK